MQSHFSPSPETVVQAALDECDVCCTSLLQYAKLINFNITFYITLP